MHTMNRRNFLKTGAAAAGALSVGATANAAGSETRPNIVLLMTDQHRFDCLGVFGNSAIQTPNLDRLAHDGALFTSGFSSVPSCTAARAGLLTGMSPWHHGMLGYGRVAPRYKVELPRELRNGCYDTLAIGKMHWYPQRNLHGFHKTILDESGRAETPDFESDYRRWFRENGPKDKEFNATGIGWNDYDAKQYVLPEEFHPTVWTGNEAVEYIDGYERDNPFFLKVSFARPHSPYDPPKRFWDAYSDDDMPAPSVGNWCEKYAPRSGTNNAIWHGDLGVDQAKNSRRGYYGSISFIDEQVGRILNSLEERNMLDNTLIFFTSDHGDMLGDHHMWRKTYAYEGSAKVPFIVRPPKGSFDHVRGKTFNQPVELRDILPTCLDAAKCRIPDGVDGMSIYDLFRNAGSEWREYIDFEHDQCYGRDNHWNALCDGRWKYVYFARTGQQQLFDLQEDPGELRDLGLDNSAEAKRKVSEWRGNMIEQFRERGEPFLINGDLNVRDSRLLYSPSYPGTWAHKVIKV